MESSLPKHVLYIAAKNIMLQICKKHQWQAEDLHKAKLFSIRKQKGREKTTKSSFQGNIIFLLQKQSEINYVASTSLNILDSERKIQQHKSLSVLLAVSWTTPF